MSQEMGIGGARLRPLTAVLLCGLVLTLLAGCSFTQSAFARTASNTGATFAAAAYTLEQLHSGRITAAYATASFVNFQSALQGVDQQLTSAQGAPGADELHDLLAVYQKAMRAVNAPCLESSCAWGLQIAQLQQASKAFLEAAT